MNNLVFVVCHKKCSTPSQAPYRAISVGPNRESVSSFWSDDTKENIAEKNPNYCELTAQYWVWKNVSAEYDSIGLCHYRRFFARSKINRFSLLDDKRISEYLEHSDIILPEKWYWEETVYEKYFKQGEGKEKDLEVTRQVISELYKDYIPAFDKILNSRGASYCNMAIMRTENFDNYNEWLFKILYEIENRVDISGYSAAEARIFGYLSEILLNVWVEHNKLKIKYLPIIETEVSKGKQLRRDIQNMRRRFKGV